MVAQDNSTSNHQTGLGCSSSASLPSPSDTEENGHFKGTSQLSLTPQTSELAGKFCSFATRALVSIERKYGPCSKTDGTIISVDKLLDEEKNKE
ncbi:hypothetical protein LINGRAHAP2_LOCUS8152, partial [Linum grandiflorum]